MMPSARYHGGMVWELIGTSLGAMAAKASDVLDLTAALTQRQSEREQTRRAVRRSYVETWAHVRSIPGWEALEDRSRDLIRSPRTRSETECVRRILIHFAWTLDLHKAKRYRLPTRIDADLRNFLSYPLPLDAWRELRAYHEPSTVAFVERVLRGDGPLV